MTKEIPKVKYSKEKNMKYKKLTKENVVKLLIKIQNNGDLKANSIATKAIKDFGLQREHLIQTSDLSRCK